MKRKLFVGFLLVLAAGFLPARLAAQSSVTPTVAPTPPGKFIVVNNGPGDQTDPHVSGDLVCYANSDGNTFTVHYFNLATGMASTVPGTPFGDFLCDVRGSTIAFTRVSVSRSAIFTLDTSFAGAQPVEVAPLAGSMRQAAQIGDQTIAWQDFGFSPSTAISDIVAYDRQSGTTTRLSNDSALNESPGISPDGKVIAWGKCATITSPCLTWKATLSNGNWTAQQLVSQVGGNQSHPDTDGTTIGYGADSGAGDQLVWQPVGGGTERVLNLQGGQGSTPSMSGGLIAFSALAAGATQHHLAIYDVATNTLYNVTADLTAAGLYPGGDDQLSDISVTPDGKVRVVWQTQQTDLNVYAYTFNLPTADLAIRNLTFQRSVESGDYLLYIFAVQNLGPEGSSNVVVSDPLPAGTSFIAAFPTQGTCTAPTPANAGMVSCNLGNLAKGAFAFVGITVKATASSGTSITNTVAVSGASFDANTANNSVTIVTPVVADNDRQREW